MKIDHLDLVIYMLPLRYFDAWMVEHLLVERTLLLYFHKSKMFLWLLISGTYVKNQNMQILIYIAVLALNVKKSEVI